jgi:hypothetical protein
VGSNPTPYLLSNVFLTRLLCGSLILLITSVSGYFQKNQTTSSSGFLDFLKTNQFFITFFWPTPNLKFFLGSSYLPQPTYRPSSYQPPYLPDPADPLPTHLLLHSLPLQELPT